MGQRFGSQFFTLYVICGQVFADKRARNQAVCIALQLADIKQRLYMGNMAQAEIDSFLQNHKVSQTILNG